MNSRLYRKTEEQPKWNRTTWGAVLGWAIICLLRMLVGFIAWVIVIVCGFLLVSSIHPEIRTPRDASTSLFVVISLLPVLMIVSAIFVPLVSDADSGGFSGRIKVITATSFLIIPAMVLQVYAALVGGFWPIVANFFVATGVCFLVSLALGEDRRRQFFLLLIAGTHGISLWVFLLIADLLISPVSDGGASPVNATFLPGAIPPFVLLGWLFFRCRRRLNGEGSGGSRRQPASRSSLREECDISSQESLLTDLQVGEETLSSDSPQSKIEGRLENENMFFYVGADNEPIGPISLDVLLQLRRSGAVTDETFIAREGEADWAALGDRLGELESFTTS